MSAHDKNPAPDCNETAQPIDLDTVVSADFTGGLDPVAYLDKLHGYESEAAPRPDDFDATGRHARGAR